MENKKKPKLNTITVSGGDQDRTIGADEIPEDVRAYLEELGNQIREDGEEGTAVTDDMLPDHVRAYFDQLGGGKRCRIINPDNQKVGSLDSDMLGKIMAQEIPRWAKKDGFVGKEYEATTAMLILAWSVVCEFDEDWRALNYETAVLLWLGVAMAMWEITKYAAEDDGDEEESD